MKNLYLLLALTTSLTASHAQVVAPDPDTLTVVQYNLTHYGNSITGCTSANNGLTMKDANLRKTINYLLPDVFGVNEINRNPLFADRLLALVLNTGGRTWYGRAQGSNIGADDIVSQIFYDTRKLAIASETGIATALRDILHVRFYKLPLVGSDSSFINFYVGHLKAGNSAPDRQTRDQEATILVAYLRRQPANEQAMLMGDLNVYSSSEAFYQRLTSRAAGGPFRDPINRPGSWSDNSSFRDIHTQSPRTVSNGCLVGGGLDDRFDQFLMTPNLLPDSVAGNYAYLPGSYKAIGNDGNRFNGDINDPANRSVPDSVADALYIASDHLPIQHRLLVRTITSNAKRAPLPGMFARLHQGTFTTRNTSLKLISCRLYTLDGRMVETFTLQAGATQHRQLGLPRQPLLLHMQAPDGRYTAVTLIDQP